MQLIALTMLINLLSAPGPVKAENCAYSDGGYCVSSIASQTAEKIGIVSKANMWGESNWGIATWAIGGTTYLNYYENIWDQLVKDGKVAVTDRESAFDEARNAGGTKIGGVNLVVLGARTLQKLVDLKVLTVEEAQQILNEAKRHDGQ